MDDKQYIEQRLDSQKDWYSKNSQKNQQLHKRLQIMQALFAASIPFFVGVIPETHADGLTLKITVGALGILIAVITAITAVYKFEDNWIKYRTTAESLKHQKYLYQTRIAPYNGAEPFPLLVERVESLISQENRDWSQNMVQANEKKAE